VEIGVFGKATMLPGTTTGRANAINAVPSISQRIGSWDGFIFIADLAHQAEAGGEVPAALVPVAGAGLSNSTDLGENK
jgi:hypothetical protein